MEVLDGKMLYEEDDTFEDDGEEWQEDWEMMLFHFYYSSHRVYDFLITFFDYYSTKVA